MTKFNIGSKEYTFPEMDMNFIIDIGEYGVDFDDFFKPKSLLKVLRAIISISADISIQEAGAEIQAAFLNGEIETIATAYQEVLEKSGFFQEILKQAEESQGTDDQPSEEPNEEPKKAKTRPKAKVVEK